MAAGYKRPAAADVEGGLLVARPPSADGGSRTADTEPPPTRRARSVENLLRHRPASDRAITDGDDDDDDDDDADERDSENISNGEAAPPAASASTGHDSRRRGSVGTQAERSASTAAGAAASSSRCARVSSGTTYTSVTSSVARVPAPPPLPPGLKKRPQSDDACARSHGSILRPQAHTGCAAAAHAPSSQRAPVREAPFTPCLPRARPAPTGCGPFRCRGGGARGGRLPLLAQPLAITPSGDDVNSPSIVRGIDRINLTAPTPTPAAMVRGRARGRSCLFRGSGADA